MLDMGDPAIKLFGKTIPLLASDGDAPVAGEKEVLPESESDSGERRSEEPELEDDEHKEASEVKSMDTEQPDEETQEEQEMLEMKENSKIPDTEDSTAKGSQNDEKDETKNSQQRPMKKPDKILPCPRCNSMDTKFCYYNNYNVNQPRHFCKSCQRYWTAGGTMRNVPVGAGRRKNKSSALRYCHITVSEALQAAQLNGTNGVHHPTLKSNGTVLTFGTDSPLCESMASVLNIGEKQVLNGAIRNGIHKVDRIVSAPCRSGENGDDQSSGSAITTTSSMEESAKKASQEPIKQNLNGFPNQVPCFQWPYVWNPAVPVPPFCTGYPMSFYPAPYWNGAIPWNVPWLAPCSPGQKSPSSNPSSPTLGKHSRDGEILQSNPDAEKNLGTSPVLVPKTLRIYDPDEAAKSSIWTTLGIKNEKGDPLTKGGFFNRFQSKTEDKSRKLETSPALKANPAALCRSINFKETA